MRVNSFFKVMAEIGTHNPRIVNVLQMSKKLDHLNERTVECTFYRQTKAGSKLWRSAKGQRQRDKQELSHFTYPSVTTLNITDHMNNIYQNEKERTLQTHQNANANSSITVEEIRERQAEASVTRPQAVTVGPKEQAPRIAKVEMSGCKVSIATDEALKLIAKQAAPIGYEVANKEAVIEHVCRIAISQMVKDGDLDEHESPYYNEALRQGVQHKAARVQTMTVKVSQDTAQRWDKILDSMLEDFASHE